jgi:DNA (cytosine-5)-methyltransferase 1
MAQNGHNHAIPTDVSGCVQHKGLNPTGNEAGTVIAFQERGRADGRNLEWQENQSYALRAIEGGGCGDWFRLAHRSAVRRLTPRECERLQGFPDDWTLIPYRGKPAVDGPRYKVIGNSMAVPVVAWLGQRIRMVDNLIG